MIADRFERELPTALTELAEPRVPDYLTDILGQTAATRQRPAWASLRRWLPMEIATTRVLGTRMPWRQLAILALLTIMLTALLAVYAGSRPRLPPPFGLAANGDIVSGLDGDIVVRTDLTSAPMTVLGGPTDDHDPGYSPDGTRLLFVRTEAGRDWLMTSGPDGSNVKRVLADPIIDPRVAFAPDSRTIAVVNSWGGAPRLSIAHLDGSPPTPIPMTDVMPTDVAWRPPDGKELLVRARKLIGGTIDFYLVRFADDGSTSITPLGLEPHENFGSDWDNSGPSWSADGSTIYYNVVERATGDMPDRFRIHRINADGTGDRTLPGPAPNVMEAWPYLSPDGTSILVEHWIWADQPDPYLTLAVMPADGSATAHEVGPRVNDDKDIDRAWSPDGTRILARTGEATIVSIDPVTGDYEPTGWTSSGFPDWQRRAR